MDRSQSNGRIWVRYAGARWYNAGAAVVNVPDNFKQAGKYHGFPVYRAKNGRQDLIFVAAAQGGPFTPYQRAGH